ncbi:MAG: hypothetical protein IKK75_03515 [Clostridia bacterium]|nr:hypothetical protein [Clostridia bacterium]
MASRSKKRRALEAHTATKQPPRPITFMDVDAAYRKGFTEGYEAGREEGFKESAMVTIQRTYSAILCSAHELFRFGQKRGVRLLNRMHEVLIETLADEELAQRVLDEVGVEIDWGKPDELAKPKEPMRKSKDAKEA